MVVSAAVTGIPIIEELESARPNARKVAAGNKPGTKKGASVISTTNTNQKQSKNKPKEKESLGSKGLASKDPKSGNQKSVASVQTKAKIAGSKGDVKSVSAKPNTAKTAEKGNGPRGVKQQNLPSKGSGRGQARVNR